MRIMMEDDQIHDDIVAELWRLYRACFSPRCRISVAHPKLFLVGDRNTDKSVRRGAIIILGMLALARREIVTNKVDALIRIGLGPLGKVLGPLNIFQVHAFTSQYRQTSFSLNILASLFSV